MFGQAIFSGEPINGSPTLGGMPKRVNERTEFGVRLRQARLKANLTQVQLAAMVGITQGSLAELEKAGRGSTYTSQLASACGVRVQWLAEGSGEMIEMGTLTREIADLAAQIDALPRQKRDWVLRACRHALEIVSEAPPINEGEPVDIQQMNVTRR